MNLNGVDLFKFLFSFAVVAIHAHLLDGQEGSIVSALRIVENLAVPFFFIVSGFFLGKKISEGNEFEVYKHYICRFLKMYMIWCFVYLPINIYYELIVYKFSLGFTVFDLIRGWLLVGENPYSWPLWYLLASAVAVLLIYIFRKFKFSFSIILLCSLVLFIIGYCYTTYHDALYNLNPFSHNIMMLYDKSFRTTRNGFFAGLAYIMLGLFLAKYNSKKVACYAFVGGLILAFFNRTFCLLPLGYGVVGFLIHLHMGGNNSIFKKLRILSIWVYLIHMLVVVILLNIFPSIDNINLYLFTIMITLILAIIVCQFMKLKSFKWLESLI